MQRFRSEEQETVSKQDENNRPHVRTHRRGGRGRGRERGKDGGGFSPLARNNRNYAPTIYNSALPVLHRSLGEGLPLSLPPSVLLPRCAQLNVITSVVADNFPRLFAEVDSKLRFARPGFTKGEAVNLNSRENYGVATPFVQVTPALRQSESSS